MLDRVAEALKENFKATVAASAGLPFEETGVTVPTDAVWQRYARAAVEALRDPSDEMVKALHRALDERAVSPAAAGQENDIAEAITEMFAKVLV